jgi:hypothetical protein
METPNPSLLGLAFPHDVGTASDPRWRAGDDESEKAEEKEEVGIRSPGRQNLIFSWENA